MVFIINMGFLRVCTTVALGLVTLASAQTVAPSNASSDILPILSSPRFWVNATKIGFLVSPLSFYSQISHDSFVSIDMEGTLLQVDDSNANNLKGTNFAYISCDPQDYTGVLTASQIVSMVSASQGEQVSIILYSTTANHCSATNLQNRVSGVFTTLDTVVAADVEQSLAGVTGGVKASILPDLSSYTQFSGGQPGSGGGSSSGTSPVAMIVLYTITALITALFLIIIVSGAIRAHRHPERYGPLNVAGRPRQSRARGVARAMLETLPIVKFGDHENASTKPPDADIELHGTESTKSSAESSKGAAVDAVVTAKPETESSKEISANALNADGTDEAGQLGCSICTEDFSKGEEVRVLPCNHKFHPACVDPWLLNVSGTCPLCRIDLRPKEQQPSTSTGATDSHAGRRISILDGSFAPPLGPFPLRLDRASSSARRDTIQSLRQTVTGTREERIAALRRFAQQRQNRNSIVDDGAVHAEDDGRGLASRLRERFRVRTRRQGDETGDVAQAETTTEGASNSAGRQSIVSPPVPVWTT